MKTLIITMPGDVHAYAVGWALDRLGHRSSRWVPQELERATATAYLSSEAAVDVVLDGPDGELSTHDLSSVWLRRFRAPRAGADWSPGDRVVAERESEGFLRGLHFAIGRRALWANSPTAQRTACLKTAQLVAARDVGFAIPRTVMTNDMAEVRRFLQATRGRVIHKGFYPAVWRGADGEVVLQTSIVTEDDLVDDDALKLSPGIFQEFVAKRAELRVLVFGRTCIAAEITDQDELDWRTTHQMRLAPCQLPAEVEARLFAVMDRLGLAMGIIDLIVTPDGEHVFLEINEQGQFLWVEAMNPEIAVLEPFARFLAAGDSSFRWTGAPSPELGFASYMAGTDAAELERELARRDPGDMVVPDLTTRQLH